MKQKLNRKALLLTMLMMAAGHVWGTTTYVKVTSTDDLVAGEKYILAAVKNGTTYVAVTSSQTTQLATTTSGFSVSDNTISVTTASPIEFTLGVSSDQYTLKVGNKYLRYNGSNNLDFYTSSSSSNKTRWTHKQNSNGEYVLFSVSNSSYYIGLGTVTDGTFFRAYSGSNSQSYPIGCLYRKSAESLTLLSACTDGTNYYGTFSSTHAFVVPSGLTMSAVGVDGEGCLVVTDYAAGDVVKANTGVMVSSTTPGEHTVALSTEAGTKITGNLLKASGDGLTATQMTNANTAGCRFYRLTMHNGSDLGFWWGAGDGAAFALDAHKAYLAVPEAQAARAGFSFVGDDGTGIVEVQAVSSSDRQHVYDLSGRRASNNTKGISVVGGRKVLRR